MVNLEVDNSAEARNERSLTLLCFFAVYVIWGSTYLGIRFAVADLPPVFAAGVRFSIAGTALYLWSRLRGDAAPTRFQWRNLAIQGAVMFLLDIRRRILGRNANSVRYRRRSRCHITDLDFSVGGIRLPRNGVEVEPAGGHPVRVGRRPAAGLDLERWKAGSASLRGCSAEQYVLVVRQCALQAHGPASFEDNPRRLRNGAGRRHAPAAFRRRREFPPLPHFTLKSSLALLYLIVAGSLLAYTAYVWLLSRCPQRK